jgi:hypothetical protein
MEPKIMSPFSSMGHDSFDIEIQKSLNAVNEKTPRRIIPMEIDGIRGFKIVFVGRVCLSECGFIYISL